LTGRPRKSTSELYHNKPIKAVPPPSTASAHKILFNKELFLISYLIDQILSLFAVTFTKQDGIDKTANFEFAPKEFLEVSKAASND
jgi:hypothetical protein